MTLSCIIFVELHWLCPSLFAGNSPLSIDVVSTMRSMTPMKSYTIFGSARKAKPPCFHSAQSHSLALALFYYICTTMFQLLHVAVVEPLSSTWLVIAIVNSWNPLACVGVDWAMLCSYHAMHAMLRVVSGLVNLGDGLEWNAYIPVMRVKCSTCFG